MSISFKPLPVLALLAWTTPLWAQEATETPTEPPAADAATADDAAAAPAEGEATDPATELGTGEAADPATELGTGEAAEATGEPQVGQPYIREEFGDWALRCVRAEEGPDPCQLYQLLLDEGGNPTAEIVVFPLPEGEDAAAGAEIVVPLMTLLPEGVTLSLDGATERVYPFLFCNEAGCITRLGLTAEEVATLKAGSSAKMSIVPLVARNQTVELTISLSGFTAGFESAAAAAPAE